MSRLVDTADINNVLMCEKSNYGVFAVEIDNIISGIISRCPSIEIPRWIPVSERLPEEGKVVISSTEYGIYPETMYTKEYGWEWAYESGADYWKELEGVIAWMPLPEPYTEESEG